jgi:hypothetical protein
MQKIIIKILAFAFIVFSIFNFLKYSKRSHSKISATESEMRVSMADIYNYQQNYAKKHGQYDEKMDFYKFINSKQIEICPSLFQEHCEVNKDRFIYIYKIKIDENNIELWKIDETRKIEQIK